MDRGWDEKHLPFAGLTDFVIAYTNNTCKECAGAAFGRWKWMVWLLKSRCEVAEELLVA